LQGVLSPVPRSFAGVEDVGKEGGEGEECGLQDVNQDFGGVGPVAEGPAEGPAVERVIQHTGNRLGVH